MDIFLELLQVAVGTRTKLSRRISAEEWEAVYALSKKQALLGVMYAAVQQLPETDRPDAVLMMTWYGMTERIRRKGKRFFYNCVLLSNDMLKNGKRHAILKGQGMALLYPDPLLRGAGDIDVWVPGDRLATVDYMRRRTKVKEVVYHHCETHLGSGDKVEIHFLPSWMYAYWLNRRLLRFFEATEQTDFAMKVSAPDGLGDFYVATPAFNRVYLLIHIFRHLFQEGIGLRQLMDYYYVLREGCTAEERKAAMQVLQSLHLGRFAGAVMYVLQKVFRLPDDCLLTDPDLPLGEFLFSEVMRAGNFGRGDDRIRRDRHTSVGQLFVRHVLRNFRFVRYFPEEVLATPCFKIWHYCWRRHHGWI